MLQRIVRCGRYFRVRRRVVRWTVSGILFVLRHDVLLCVGFIFVFRVE